MIFGVNEWIPLWKKTIIDFGCTLKSSSISSPTYSAHKFPLYFPHLLPPENQLREDVKRESFVATGSSPYNVPAVSLFVTITSLPVLTPPPATTPLRGGLTGWLSPHEVPVCTVALFTQWLNVRVQQDSDHGDSCLVTEFVSSNLAQNRPHMFWNTSFEVWGVDLVWGRREGLVWFWLGFQPHHWRSRIV